VIDSLILQERVSERNSYVELTKLKNSNTLKLKSIYDSFLVSCEKIMKPVEVVPVNSPPLVQDNSVSLDETKEIPKKAKKKKKEEVEKPIVEIEVVAPPVIEAPQIIIEKEKVKAMGELLLRSYATKYFNFLEVKSEQMGDRDYEGNYSPNFIRVTTEYHFITLNDIPYMDDIFGKMQNEFQKQFRIQYEIKELIPDSTSTHLREIFPSDEKKFKFHSENQRKYLMDLQSDEVVSSQFLSHYGQPKFKLVKKEITPFNDLESLRNDEREINKVAEKLSELFLESNKELLNELQNITDVSALKIKFSLN
jgi:hypothetical protein